MFETTVIINNRLGLHARPATQIVSLCKGFQSDAYLLYDGQKVNLKSIIDILATGIKMGAVVELHVAGPDETEAGKQLVELINSLEE